MKISGYIGAVTLFAGILQISVAQAAGGSADIGLDYAEIVEFSAESAAANKSRQRLSSDTRLEFNALGRSFSLDLKANQRIQALAGPNAGVILYTAGISGAPDSWGRLSYRGGTWRGLLWTGNELLAIDRHGDLPRGWASKISAAPDTEVAYRVADLVFDPGKLSCGAVASGAGSSISNGQFSYAKLVDELRSATAKVATQSLQIGMLADSRFVDRFGADAEAALLERLNNIDGIFSAQVGITLSPTETVLFETSAADPFTSNDSSTLLNEVGMYKSDTPSLSSLGLVHLYTGRDLDGGTAGIAYLGELCDNRFSAGLSEGVRSLTTDSLIAAHEIGHNFGAPHDGESGSACESEPETFLMAPSINGSSTFSACSIEKMQPEISRATCLSDVSASDAAVVFANAATSVDAGQSVDLTLNVSSPGSNDISDVQVRLEIPGNLELQNISPSSGTCSASAGGADCNIGTLSGGGTQTVDLTLLATSSGSATVTATLTATGDSDNSNNTDNLSITIQPSVDLAVTWSGTGSAQQDADFELQMRVQNSSSDVASNVTASISLPTGISFISATPAAGDCSNSGQTVDCQLGNLSANAANTIAVVLRGTEANSYSITANTDATESDMDNTDNSRSIAVEITAVSTDNNDPIPPSNSSGGGAPAPLLIILLAVARLRRILAMQPKT